MTFVVRDEDAAGVQTWKKVLPGPSWGVEKAEVLFRLLAFSDLLEGCQSLDMLTVGLARARAELPELADPVERDELARLIESLATWATLGRMRGASAIGWTTDF